MPSKDAASDGVRFRRPSSYSGEGSSDYSEDQLRAVERVRRCKDYYEILGVGKDAGDSELRKQYKKLALQFHPDKNKTPGAVEAFKAIGNAFAVLSDPQKRKQYDMYGLEGAQRVHSYTENSDHAEYTHTFQGDISPEDLFNMFFGAGFTNVGTTYVRRGNQWHRYPPRTNHTHHHQEMESRSILMQIMPLLFLVSVTLLSNVFISDPVYSMQRTSKFLYERKTHNLEIPYYVKESFDTDYKGRIPNLEKQIEEEYIINLRASCYRERNYRENMIWRAKTFRDIALEEKARALRTPSCDALNELYYKN